MVVSVNFVIACAAASSLSRRSLTNCRRMRNLPAFTTCAPKWRRYGTIRIGPNELVVSLCLHQQIQRLQRCYGPNRVTNNIRRLGRVKKKCAKQEEAKQIAIETVKNGGNIPPGNSLSYFAGQRTTAPACLDGTFPRGTPLDID
ncbi:hypothetical protein [Rhizobium etli]|uniref:Uncharacterized protein n=1 Tax=Rhizobium etli TaxID=29449 RepID=A0A7W6ZJI7_RHIET|nr:hypothetical protein [Rhizobium etli]MBB4481147.1 hypothetical protein [Rhizobium etli]MBB4537238.1 hypothetical protein [Rhizobium etli]